MDHTNLTMAECCVTEHYQNLSEHYTALLDSLTTSLEELSDRPDWAEAWELGVRWAAYDPNTIATQRNLHRVMARVPFDLVRHA